MTHEAPLLEEQPTMDGRWAGWKSSSRPAAWPASDRENISTPTDRGPEGPTEI